MAASYPASVKDFGNDRLDGDYILPADVNDLRAELVAVETGLLAAASSGYKKRVTGNFSRSTSTVLSDIPGLTVNVSAGKTYMFEAILYTISNVAGGVKASIAGTAGAGNLILDGLVYSVTLSQIRSSTLGATHAALTATSSAHIRISGTITVNASGTLLVQFAQNASHAAASSVLAGSTFAVDEVA
jgi:hypothetical protein